uniref:Copia protein n=1 Tax=Cajanus cajan TaxID=3821 RepID=A0A151QVN7_CAJCA|nr:Copia protein [Cajanus cajan]
MTGDPSKFSSLKLKNEGFVTYGDNNKGKIIGHGNIRNSSSSTLIENVLLVEGLKHYLLSISQLSDKGFKIEFDNTCCLICHKLTKEIRFIRKRIDNIYMLDLEHSITIYNTKCLITKEDNIWLWHRRAAHIHMDHLNKLSRKELVIGLPKLKFSKDKLCDPCQKGKQVKASFKRKIQISTSKPLQLIHMDLFGPSRTMSLGGNYYGIVIVDDYSRFTWVMFLANKSEAFNSFKKFAKLVQNEKNTNITLIRSDHGGEFQNFFVVDNTLFVKKFKNDTMYVQIYVDDIVFGSTNSSLCKEFAKTMQGEFEMSMTGELTFFLGLQIKQMSDEIFISQNKYCNELLKKFGMEGCKEAATPISNSCNLDLDEKGIAVGNSKYRGIIGSLLYLTASRPDIIFVVCLCARFQANPKESHMKSVKSILKYLRGTTNVGIWYPKGVSLSMIDYSDSDYAGCRLDRKSTSGTCHLLGNALVSWHNKKQACVALSTAEDEYIVASSFCAQILWMKQQLKYYGTELNKTPLRCDNTSAINLTKNPILHSRTKHIEMRHHFLRDHVQNNDFVVKFVETNKQLVDIFTKPLPKERFNQLRIKLEIINYSCLN